MLANPFKLKDIVSCFCEEIGEQLEATIYDFNEDKTLAYIHFLHQDKRLDRWIDINKIKPFTGRHSLRWIDKEDSEEEPNADAFVQKFEDLHKQVTRIRNIDQITIGAYTIRTWYYSPYPISIAKASHLYICENCFRYFTTKEELEHHMIEKKETRPPGREIYRKGNISIFEFQGFRQKLTCQCLCLLSKLFLDHKTLFYDVEGFVFYALCECDQNGAHIAAYFSREIVSDQGNILACIVVLPPYQKKGYGQFLIALSYEIARRSKKVGGPERPLSDLGKIAFRSYWKKSILELFRARDIQSLHEIVQCTSIAKQDIIEVLKEMDCVTKIRGEYELRVNPEKLSYAIAQYEQRSNGNRPAFDPNYLIWLPEDEANNILTTNSMEDTTEVPEPSS
ncbi:MOZ/SAS family protein [Histomonas meleagridis]|uniref:MOZ/SAS family protein n=1 Tax=Histomonas meleagridis TaxID=135588 RepID=UPI00355994C7|nr:MOZ/SAS family protein [Histomonas meleagridis]KAH0800830.1 MOZ/SAS family protein [Histomonas meleagridis]